ncbi:MAG: 4-hydroxy-tetrahydrodipicolinate synthase [Bacteroidetes bacterium]|nr:MAG: 4-hydroxy-tetrahydrodipicolinate synthase [Bacteroidota bacterium]
MEEHRNSALKGTGVALITPFKNDKVDFKSFENLLKHTQDHVNYWLVNGTTAESVTVSDQEKAKLLAFAKEHNPRKLPLVYGVGGNHTKKILEDLKNTDFDGVSAILSVSPYYNKPSQAGIVAHYTAVADASPVPVILYNVPGRTSSNMTASTTLKLAEHPNIIGIKEASANLAQALEIAKYKPADFLLISGDDLVTLPMMAFGACGVISVLANAFTNFGQIISLCAESKYEQASKILYEFVEINDLMYLEGNPVGIKQVLAFQKVIASPQVRLPMVQASRGLQESIKKAIGKMKF